MLYIWSQPKASWEMNVEYIEHTQEIQIHWLSCERRPVIRPLPNPDDKISPIKHSIPEASLIGPWLQWLTKDGERRTSENKRADCRHHLAIYSVCSAQFFPFQLFLETIKRDGMDSFQQKHQHCILRRSIGLTQDPYKPLNINPVSPSWVFLIGEVGFDKSLTYVLSLKSLLHRLSEINLHTGQAVAEPFTTSGWKTVFSTGTALKLSVYVHSGIFLFCWNCLVPFQDEQQHKWCVNKLYLFLWFKDAHNFFVLWTKSCKTLKWFEDIKQCARDQHASIKGFINPDECKKWIWK